MNIAQLSANRDLVRIAFYEHDARFLHVTRKGRSRTSGIAFHSRDRPQPAYWVTDKLVYEVDYRRGIDMLRWSDPTLPGGVTSAVDLALGRGRTCAHRRVAGAPVREPYLGSHIRRL